MSTTKKHEDEEIVEEATLSTGGTGRPAYLGEDLTTESAGSEESDPEPTAEVIGEDTADEEPEVEAPVEVAEEAPVEVEVETGLTDEEKAEYEALKSKRHNMPITHDEANRMEELRIKIEGM